MSKKNQPEASKRFHPIYPDSWVPKEKGEVIEGVIFMKGEKPIEGDLVPYCELIQPDGDVIQVLMGAASLARLHSSPEFKDGRHVAIRFDGESKTVQKAGNYMKLFSFILSDEDGEPIDPRQVMNEDGADAVFDSSAVTKAGKIEDSIRNNGRPGSEDDLPI